jgi:hypothetical protein
MVYANVEITRVEQAAEIITFADNWNNGGRWQHRSLPQPSGPAGAWGTIPGATPTDLTVTLKSS